MQYVYAHFILRVKKYVSIILQKGIFDNRGIGLISYTDDKTIFLV